MIAVIMEFLVWLEDFLFSRRKSYQGRHYQPEKVAKDYHPMPELCGYPGLWRARIDGSISYLKVHIDLIPRLARLSAMQNWGWLNYSTDEWPEVWRARNG